MSAVPPESVRQAQLVIVGAGPAGVSAALWAASQGLSPLLLEAAERPGGQLLHVHFHPGELPGIEAGDGPAIAATYARQLASATVEVQSDTVARGLEGDARQAVVVTATGEKIGAEAVLIACGVRRRRLGVPGEDRLEGQGVSFSASLDRERFAGKPVVVVGGGDAAFENALILSDAECQVALAVRDTTRARRSFRDRVAADTRIEVLERTEVVAFDGESSLEQVRMRGPGGEFDRAAEGAVIKIGMLPNTEWCRHALVTDAEGYIKVDARHRTSRVRVWAAGDVTGPSLPSIAVATGQAALALGDIRDSLAG